MTNKWYLAWLIAVYYARRMACFDNTEALYCESRPNGRDDI